jgi:hypothetical protein
MTTTRAAIDRGDTNNLPAAMRLSKAGSVLHAGGVRIQRDVGLAVTGDATAPKYTIKKLLFCEVTGGSGGNEEKAPVLRGATVAAHQAAPAADGKTIGFYASEVTGPLAVAEIHYTTTDPVKDEDGNVAQLFDDTKTGLI